MSPEEALVFKQAIKEACQALLEQRIAHAKLAMDASQESANSEDKSSAGDKYETARAMGQADRDMNARQWSEAVREKDVLDAIIIQPLETVGLGSLLRVDGRYMFIAIGLGPLRVREQEVVVLSAGSPLYQAIRQKSTGDSVIFNNRTLRIELVC
jgi:hypothetical protein